MLSIVRNMKFILWVLLVTWTQTLAVTLGWDIVEDSRVAGYEIHYGDNSCQYTEIVDIEGSDVNTVDIDVDANIYWFAVRSRNHDASNVSKFSNEINGIRDYPDLAIGVPACIFEWHIAYLHSGDTEPMATVTRTVAASGADHTTIAAALSWFQSNHDFDTDGIARIQITDTSSYTISSSLTLNGIPGTPAIDAYLEVTSNASDPFSGPTINCTHSSSGCLHVDMDFTYIHNLYFELNNTSNSTECIRVLADSDSVLISRNVFIALNQQSDQDGIYTGNWTITDLRIDNSVFVGFARAGINIQRYTTSSNQSIEIDSCSIAVGTISGESDGGGIIRNTGSTSPFGGTVDVTVYNTFVYDYKDNSNADFFNQSAAVDGSYYGSNNISEDTSAESNFTSSYDSVTFTESSPSSGENAWLTEIDNADETLIDLSIAGENAYTVTGNGVDRTGSEPDARQDFSTDIMGTNRASTPDIGVFEFVPAGATASSIPPQMQKSFAHLLVR